MGTHTLCERRTQRPQPARGHWAGCALKHLPARAGATGTVQLIWGVAPRLVAWIRTQEAGNYPPPRFFRADWPRAPAPRSASPRQGARRRPDQSSPAACAPPNSLTGNSGPPGLGHTQPTPSASHRHRHAPVAAPASHCLLLEPARRVVRGRCLGRELRHARAAASGPSGPSCPSALSTLRLAACDYPCAASLAAARLSAAAAHASVARAVESPSVAAASSSCGAVPSTCRSGERAHSASGRRVLGRLYARYRPQGRPGRRAAGCACAAPIWRRVIRPFRREQLLATLVGLAPRAPLAEQPSGACRRRRRPTATPACCRRRRRRRRGSRGGDTSRATASSPAIAARRRHPLAAPRSCCSRRRLHQRRRQASSRHRPRALPTSARACGVSRKVRRGTPRRARAQPSTTSCGAAV